MRGRWGIALVAVALLTAGCLSAIGGDETGPDDEVEQANATTDAEDNGSDLEPAGNTSTVRNASIADLEDCEAIHENVTQLMENKSDDPFAERPPLEPALKTCGEEGVFYLAAHGLQGKDLVSMAWSFPEPTTCEELDGVASGEGHFDYYVVSSKPPGEDIGVGGGSGGDPAGAFLGPAYTRDVVNPLLFDEGSGAWGGTFGFSSDEPGVYRTTYAMTNWGATENRLTQGASLLFMLVCEDPFTFEGFSSSPTVELFSGRDMDAGAGAYAVFSAASGGVALDTTLDDGGQLRAFGGSLGGSGAILVADENGTEEHTYGPVGFAHVARDVPPGPLRVATAQGSAIGLLQGVAFAPLEDVPAESVVRPV